MPPSLEAAPPTEGSADARTLAGAIDEIASFVTGFEPCRYSGSDAVELVSLFTKLERLGAAGKTLAAARAAAANCHHATGARSPAHWLSAVTGESLGNAIDVLNLGDAMERLPGVGDAYREARISSSGAKLVASAVKVNPKSEGELIEVAQKGTLKQLKDRCLRAKAQGRSEEDAAHAYERIRSGRHCRTWTDTDGAFRLDARMTPDAGASLLSALTAESNRYFERARANGLHESQDAYAADALVALVTGRGILGPAGMGAGQGPPGTRIRRNGSPGPKRSELEAQGDVGGTSADRSVAAHCPSDAVRAPDPKAIVHLRVDLDALRRGALDDGERCEIPGVGPIPIATARELMGDSITDLVITNGVDVTTVCHLGRSIPASLKTAVIARDETCVVPGCDVATGLEFDHWAVSFAEGGAASLENLARLCGHHHYLRTHKGFHLEGGPGRWSWRSPVERCGTDGSDDADDTDRADGTVRISRRTSKNEATEIRGPRRRNHGARNGTDPPPFQPGE